MEAWKQPIMSAFPSFLKLFFPGFLFPIFTLSLSLSLHFLIFSDTSFRSNAVNFLYSLGFYLEHLNVRLSLIDLIQANNFKLSPKVSQFVFLSLCLSCLYFCLLDTMVLHKYLKVTVTSTKTQYFPSHFKVASILILI